MQIKILPSSKVRDKMASIIQEMQKDGTPYFVTQYGKAAAVLMSIDYYNDIIRKLELLEKGSARIVSK